MSRSMADLQARYSTPEAQATREAYRAQRQQNNGNGSAPAQRPGRRQVTAQQRTQPEQPRAQSRDLSREMAREAVMEEAGLSPDKLRDVADALVHVPERRSRNPQQRVQLTDEQKYANSTPQERREAWERGEAPYGVRQDGTPKNPPGRPKLEMLDELETSDPADVVYGETDYGYEPEYVPPVQPRRQERTVPQQRKTARLRRNPGTTATITISAPKPLADAIFDLIANVGFDGVTPDHITGGAYINSDDEWEIVMQEDRRTAGNVNVRYINLIYDQF
jgi:hypothetical protein